MPTCPLCGKKTVNVEDTSGYFRAMCGCNWYGPLDKGTGMKRQGWMKQWKELNK